MNSFALNPVPEILFGPGRLADLPKKAEALAGRGVPLLLVADPALKGLGITALASDILEKAGFTSETYDGFTGEPRAHDVDAATALARRFGAKLIVGLGGGSALDTAKLVACCAVSGLSAMDYALCATPLPSNRLPVIAIPTTAGTGSEVTAISVFSDAGKVKVWAFGQELKPDVAILDPELTVPVPPHVTAATGLDAIVHAIEAATNKHAHAGNDLYALEAIRLIAAHLQRAVSHPDDIEARGALLLGACYGGIAIDKSGTALAHHLSPAVADLAPIAHGRATGLAMLATMDWVMEGNRPAFARVAQAMGGGEPVQLFDRLVRASGIKVSLEGDGLDLANPQLLARHMASPANAPMRKSTMRYPSADDLVMLAGRFLSLR